MTKTGTSKVSVKEGYEEEPLRTVENPIPAIIDKFADVFEWPEKLPPQKGNDHHIYLKKGVDPINVQPYRYAHHQKEEMERSMDEMLDFRHHQAQQEPSLQSSFVGVKERWELEILCRL
ncbi:ty3-gypsy retroelement transposase [Cucumis melo var. makuwa]|uniref:Ty3-gypsy retroelement transposase n=1 Tax=Cucumis melo var. makuwa TaxID=1194695 RepID=A0A5D3E0N9_CUCMM|nr:ty3-gypsy retroelement transposase [Cucumis melo var. makuwa]TYK29288.1 ty3-gypsy retroelement transposase [Cucumis melo var. makuwa]